MKDSPKAGPLATIMTYLFGTMLNFDKVTQENITFWLQASAFAVSLIVGLLTIYISIKKIRRDK